MTALPVEAAERLVLDHLAMARGLALRYRGRGEPVDDLVAVAHLGLVKAARAFDPDRGHDFPSFAAPTIRGEVRRYFRDHAWQVRPPRRVQELRLQLRDATADLTQQLRRAPTPSEIAAHLGTTREDVVEALAARDCYDAPSLDEPVHPDAVGSTGSLGDTLGEMDAALDAVVDGVAVRALLLQLPPRDQRLIALRFYRGLTQSEIADEFGVSQMQVSRLLRSALARLRAGLEER